MGRKIIAIVLALAILTPIGYRLYRFAQPAPIQKLYSQGLLALASGDVARAQLSVEALSTPGIQPAYHQVLSAAIDLKLGRVHSAATRLNRALDFPPTAAVAHTLTGEALYKNRQFAAAIEMLQKAIELDEQAVDARRWLAASYYDLGATAPTVAQLKEVSKLAPSDPRPHRLIGLIYKDMESYDAAIQEYRQALQRSSDFPDRTDVLRELAFCLLKAGKQDQLDDVLKQCPFDATTLTYRAEGLYAGGQLEEAVTQVDRALAMDANHLPALLLKGNLLAEQGQLEEAVIPLQTALARHPLDNQLHYQLSQLYARQGDTAAAEKHSAEATRLRDLRAHFTELHAQASDNLNNAEVRYQLGMTAQELGHSELAITWLSAAVALKPDYPEALQALRALTAP